MIVSSQLVASCGATGPDGEVVTEGKVLMVVESEATKARLQSTQKQLALVRYENQLFNLLLDQSGFFDLSTLPEPPNQYDRKIVPALFNSQYRKQLLDWRC